MVLSTLNKVLEQQQQQEDRLATTLRNFRATAAIAEEALQILKDVAPVVTDCRVSLSAAHSTLNLFAENYVERLTAQSELIREGHSNSTKLIKAVSDRMVEDHKWRQHTATAVVDCKQILTAQGAPAHNTRKRAALEAQSSSSSLEEDSGYAKVRRTIAEGVSDLKQELRQFCSAHHRIPAQGPSSSLADVQPCLFNPKGMHKHPVALRATRNKGDFDKLLPPLNLHFSNESQADGQATFKETESHINKVHRSEDKELYLQDATASRMLASVTYQFAKSLINSSTPRLLHPLSTKQQSKVLHYVKECAHRLQLVDATVFGQSALFQEAAESKSAPSQAVSLLPSHFRDQPTTGELAVVPPVIPQVDLTQQGAVPKPTNVWAAKKGKHK